MADESIVTLTQKPDERLAGEVALYGAEKQPAIQHVIQSSEKQPIVHMVCWSEEEPCPVDVRGGLTLAGDPKLPIRLLMVQDEPCKVEVGASVTVAGDEKSPLRARIAHTFENTHVQEHKVATKLSEPIHHALQIRTPLELRFCNPWHVASDYVVDVRMAGSSLMSIRVTGATVANPQPCADDRPCPPPPDTPTHP